MHPPTRLQVGRGTPIGEQRGGESEPPNPVSSSVVFNTSPRPRKSESASAQVGQGGLWCFSQHAAVGWGNVCCSFAACRELVLGALPHLLQLDAQPLHSCVDPAPDEKQEEKHCSSSEDSDDESFSEPSAPFTTGKGSQTEAAHAACLGVSLSPGVTQAARSSGSCARLSSNSSPSPSHHPWQISSQICSRRWLGALGGGKGRPWRNTRPACRSFRSMGVCCCPLYHCSHWAQRAAYPPAQEPPQPPALGSLSSVPRQNLDAASSQKQLPS